MSEILTAWLVGGAMMLVLFLVPDVRANILAASHLKYLDRIEAEDARCVKATSRAFFANDINSLAVIDVDCCGGIPAGPQCYVTKRLKVFK